MDDMDKDELKARTKNFAHRCVKLALALPNNSLGKHISRQMIRCSTSVAANYRAVCTSQSKPTFISKLATVIEETDESAFWLEFVVEEELLSETRVTPLLNEAEELTAIFIASQNTARRNRE